MRKKRKGGQASVEFMIALATVLMVFIVSSYFVYFKITRSLDYKLYLHGTHVVNSLADSINTINRAGDGYSMTAAVPEFLFGNRKFTIKFYNDEPTVFLHSQGFSKGRPVYFSTPLSTNQFSCLLDDCFGGCNQTPYEICLNVTKGFDFRIANHDQTLYITPSYNLVQKNQGIKEQITPFVGSGDSYTFLNESVQELIDSGGLIAYLFQDEQSREYSMVFKIHQQNVDLDITNYTGNPLITFSDDELEFDFANAPEGEWIMDSGDSKWDGGILWLNKSGFRVCMNPEFGGGDVYWMNPDKNINLQWGDEFVVTYP